MNEHPTQQEPGRAGLILAFGIISICLFGPFFGIPAWVMGRTDMRKIRAGFIPESQKGMTQAGLVIGAIGTFFSPLTLIVAGILIAISLSLNTAYQVGESRDVVISEMFQIAQLAKERKETTNQSYASFSIPQQLQSTKEATYEVEPSEDNALIIQATSIRFPNTYASIRLNSDGTVTNLVFSGDF